MDKKQPAVSDSLTKLRLRLAIFCFMCVAVYAYLHKLAGFAGSVDDTSTTAITKTIQLQEKNNNHVHRQKRRRLPLHQLVQPRVPHRCRPNHTFAVTQIRHRPASRDRKIPAVVHQTGRTGCLPRSFHNNTRQWSWPNHSYYFHDDDAVHRLLYQQHWPEFPHLRNALHCMKYAGGAMMADIWRYLVLWEYGGIYADLDNAPGILMNATTIPADADAFLIPERGGILSQYFMAVSPRHPLMFLAIQDVLRQVLDMEDTRDIDVPGTSGPRCLKRAFLRFRGVSYLEIERKLGPGYHNNKKPTAGIYHGHFSYTGNRSVTVVGSVDTTRLWIWRDFIHGRRKTMGWSEMNMTDYKTIDRTPNNRSCVMELFHKYSTASSTRSELFS